VKFLDSDILLGRQKNVENFHFQWHITERCNLRCKHCYIDDHYSDELNTNEVIGIITHLARSLKQWGVTGSVSLTGGEPFLRSDLKEIVRSFRKYEQFKDILVMTNGTLILDSDIKFLLENDCSIQVSIDGLIKKQHDEIRGKGNFNKTLLTLRRLSKYGVYTTVHFVVHKSNYPASIDQIAAFLAILQAVAVKEVTFSRLVPIGRGKQMRELLLLPKEVKMLFQWLIEVSPRFPTLYLNTSRPLWAGLKNCAGGACSAGFNACTILPNGDVLPCRRLPIVLGNLKKQSFFEIWYNSDILRRLRERRKIEVCGECKLLDRCAGCRAIAYAVYGDFMARDPQCFIQNGKDNE